MRPVNVQALGLAIGPVIAAGLHALAPVETHPAQILEDPALRVARRALEVGVLDANDKRPSLAARKQPVEERRAGVADVQLTGGTGSEADSHGAPDPFISATACTAIDPPTPIEST